MQNIVRQTLQTTVPAALGFTLSRYLANQSTDSTRRINSDDAKTVWHSDSTLRERTSTVSNRPMRNSIGRPAKTNEPDYPAKDFLPYVVPHVAYAKLIKWITPDISQDHKPVDYNGSRNS